MGVFTLYLPETDCVHVWDVSISHILYQINGMCVLKVFFFTSVYSGDINHLTRLGGLLELRGNVLVGFNVSNRK